MGLIPIYMRHFPETTNPQTTAFAVNRRSFIYGLAKSRTRELIRNQNSRNKTLAKIKAFTECKKLLFVHNNERVIVLAPCIFPGRTDSCNTKCPSLRMVGHRNKYIKITSISLVVFKICIFSKANLKVQPLCMA